jgi:hypothetical protein
MHPPTVLFGDAVPVRRRYLKRQCHHTFVLVNTDKWMDPKDLN